ncbi:MAG: hypothetical protein Q7K26_05965 [bacterium]|nr:hypothetical protein [bacterium]
MRLLNIFFFIFVLLVGAVALNAYQEKWELAVVATILLAAWMVYTVLFFRARSGG